MVLMFPKGGRGPRLKDYRTADGYGSKLEQAVGQVLQAREQSGEIRNIRRQVAVVLQDGPRERRIVWKIDFSFEVVVTGLTRFAEAKGFETEVYKLKLKLFRGRPQGDLEIWKGSYKSPQLVEVISAFSDSQNQNAA
jgi:hypothetical protein